MKKTKLKIHLYGSPILRKKVRKVSEITPEILALLNDMAALMREKDGVGLAANQAGIDYQLIVIEYDNKLWKLINPVILKQEGELVFEEGCLSFPGISLKVKRANKVWVEYTDIYGSRAYIQTEGTFSVILQHEIDHINGILFIDRVSLPQRLRISAKIAKIKKMANNAARQNSEN